MVSEKRRRGDRDRRAAMTPERAEARRRGATEVAFTGALRDHRDGGDGHRAGWAAELVHSDTALDSGGVRPLTFEPVGE